MLKLADKVAVWTGRNQDFRGTISRGDGEQLRLDPAPRPDPEYNLRRLKHFVSDMRGSRSVTNFLATLPDRLSDQSDTKAAHVTDDEAAQYFRGEQPDEYGLNLPGSSPAPSPSPAPEGGSSLTLPAPSQVKQLGQHGPSQAKVEYLHHTHAGHVDEALRKLGVPMQHIASLVGAPHDSIVRLQKPFATENVGSHPGILGVNVYHPHFGRVDDGRVIPENAERNIGFHAETGKPFVENIGLFVKPEYQGSGMGREIFGRQVENLMADGRFSHILTHAAKSNPADEEHPHSGYHVWPKMGYDQDIADIKHTGLRQQIAGAYPQAQSIQDIYDEPGGQEWWRQNGRDLYNMRFDLTPGSRSVTVLQEALARAAAKQSKKGSAS